MFITMITPECAPVAKVGGLGDVVQGLSRELEVRGNDVEIILPKYDCMNYNHIWGLQKTYSDLWVPYYNHAIRCDVYFGFVDGLKCFFIEPHSDKSFFHRGSYYGHHDDPERFVFFCRAALEFLLQSNKRPDIIHCHDWQTGVVPVLLHEIYHHIGMSHSRVCYTLHNVKHQGVTGDFVLKQNGLNLGLMSQNKLLDNGNPHAVNLMKGGIVYSNFTTTVSPKYGEEIKYSEQGHGLQHTLYVHGNKFGGVLNGIDYSVWNPEVDSVISNTYSIETIDKKYRNKEALRNRLFLRKDYKPIISVVSRLDHQKGIELIKHALFYSLGHGCQFVLLGSSHDQSINDDFWQLKHELNNNPDCHLEIGYDEELAHLIYAGSDMIVIPSIFEPCGLTQMIAMKYGTLPIVRSVGGLANTVFDADYGEKPFHERNGYVFDSYTKDGLESALSRAIGMWYSFPDCFRELMVNGMKYDFSWNHPGSDYTNIYNLIRERA